MGDRPLTLPGVLAVILVIVMLIMAVLAWGGNIEPGVRAFGRIAFFVSLALFVGCIGWHFVSTRAKHDIHPDFLADLFADAQLRQMDACHIALQMDQVQSQVRYMVLAQNRYDAPAELVFSLPPRGAPMTDPIPALHLVLEPGVLVIALCSTNLLRQSPGRRLTVRPVGRCPLTGSGSLVRFGRRSVLYSESNFLASMSRFSPLGRLLRRSRDWKLILQPFDERHIREATRQWSSWQLWGPGMPTAIDDVVARIRGILGLAESPPASG